MGCLLCQYCNIGFFQSLHVVLMECVSFSALKHLPYCSLRGTVPVHGLAADLFWAFSEFILNLPDQEACFMCSDFSLTPGCHDEAVAWPFLLKIWIIFAWVLLLNDNVSTIFLQYLPCLYNFMTVFLTFLQVILPMGLFKLFIREKL